MNRNCLKQPANKHLQHRKGTMMPFIACAIMVVGCCAALVLDRLYIDAAQVELRKAAEASALASARNLVDDELIKTYPDLKTLVDHARLKGLDIARENLVAGEPLVLDDSPQGDIRFGQLVYNNDQKSTIFVETETNPHAVLVQAMRHRARGNPLALFFRELTGQSTGNAFESAEALIDNRVLELKPMEGVSIPALPLGILANERLPQQTLSWTSVIDNKLGLDNYGYDSSNHKVTNKSDGIPEIVVRSQPSNEDDPMYNGMLLNIGSNFKGADLTRQFATGINEKDMENFQLPFKFESAIPVEGIIYQSAEEADDYEAILGEPKIVFLVQEVSTAGKNGFVKLQITKPVVVRVMAVNLPGNNQIELILQPATMTTRTAVNPADPIWTEAGKDYINKYIYNLKLSN